MCGNFGHDGLSPPQCRGCGQSEYVWLVGKFRRSLLEARAAGIMSHQTGRQFISLADSAQPARCRRVRLARLGAAGLRPPAWNRPDPGKRQTVGLLTRDFFTAMRAMVTVDRFRRSICSRKAEPRIPAGTANKPIPRMAMNPAITLPGPSPATRRRNQR